MAVHGVCGSDGETENTVNCPDYPAKPKGRQGIRKNGRPVSLFSTRNLQHYTIKQFLYTNVLIIFNSTYNHGNRKDAILSLGNLDCYIDTIFIFDDFPRPTGCFDNSLTEIRA